MRPPAALYVHTSPGMNARARRSALPFAMVTLLVAGTAGLVACSDEAAADADGEPPPGDTRADGATGGGDPRNDGGTTSSDGGGAAVDSGGGQSDAGGEGGSSVIAAPTVGTITGFQALAPAVNVTSILCTSAECYFTYFGNIPGVSSDSGAAKVVNGTSTVTSMPEDLAAGGWRLHSLARMGGTLFASGARSVAGADWAAAAFKLAGNAWVQVGLQLPMRNVFADALTTDGVRLCQTSRFGASCIAPTAGPGDAWSALGTGLAAEALNPKTDAAGTVYIEQQSDEIWRLPVGTTAWTKEIAPGNEVQLAPNKDVWVHNGTALSRRAAASATWTAISIPGNASPVSAVLIDGSNTAYVTAGIPQKLYRVPSGAAAAVDTGVQVSADVCRRLAVDATGRLLASCTAAGARGLSRSTP